MKALILNSGKGTRMGHFTSQHPKCMTEIQGKETILSRQLRLLSEAGVTQVVITTGPFEEALVSYCTSLELPLSYTFVHNDQYMDTNYIYSIYLARQYLEDDDLFLMHGDLVFEASLLDRLKEAPTSVMAVSSTAELPEKDFKAVVEDGRIKKVGIDFFNRAVAAQPLYKLQKEDWMAWLWEIEAFCNKNETSCYAENAFNQISDECAIYPLDIGNILCAEIDTPEDLAVVSEKLREVTNRTVYLCFSTDIVHSGHISIINKAKKLGKLMIGVLSDEAVCSYRRFPLVPFAERKALFENINGVHKVVKQETLSYRENLEQYRPDYVVHGDDWKEGFQKPLRDEVVELLAGYGGRLVEFPYTKGERYQEMEKRQQLQLSLPDLRRSRLKKTIGLKGLVTAIEAHSGITGLIAEKTVVYQNGQARQFDAMWISSLCDSTAKGKPDIELVDMTSRFRTIDDIMEVTTKPIIFDGDTGGLTEHFVYTVKTLERMGVSMVIIEDKTGLKKNSLFGNEVVQTQDTIENFCQKIKMGKQTQKTKDFMIVARIESLILEQGMENALARAFAYVEAGADGIMIHSRKKEPAEIFEFIEKFRAQDRITPIVVVPTSFNAVTEEEFRERGVNVVIYANQLTRSGFPAMQSVARTILEHHRAQEADAICMPIKEIITLIPAEN